MVSIEGTYSDGRTSRTKDAVLRLDAGGRIAVTPPEPSADPFLSHLPADTYEITSKLGSAPRVITFPNGATFTTDDHDGIDELLDRTGRGVGGRILTKLESSLPFAAAAAVIAGVVIWATVIYGVPAMAKTVAFMLPADVERSIGKGTLKTLDQLYFEPTRLDPEVVERLESKFEPILEEYTELQPELVFRKTDIGANAFALPSGIILFTDDLVELADNDEQLESVLYHEIGHLHHRHILRRSLQGSILTVLAVFITGDVSGVNEIVAAIPALLIDASYSRDFEREADDYALSQMEEADMDLESFGEILMLLQQSHEEKMEEEGAPEFMDFLQTHPGTEERLQAIRAYGDR